MKSKILLMAFVISFSGLIISSTLRAQDNEFQLIRHETALRQDINTALHFLESKDAVTRFREVQLNEGIKSLSTISPNDQIILNLFPDARYIAQVQRVEEIMEGNITITARLHEFDYAFMVISTTEGRTLTNVYIPEKGVNYQIISDPVTLQHFLLEINPALIPEPMEYPSPIPGETTQEDIQEQERIQKEIDNTKSGPSDPATIDIMIVYTPAARIWGNSHGGIFNLIATAVAIGNTDHSNSATILTIRLVHNAEVSYTESGDVELDLNRLTITNDGYIDNVHTLRNTYGADLVQLFTTMGGGIGWLLDLTGGRATHGFSCAGVNTATAHTPIHEMGHNMGCGHHKDQNFQAGPGLYSYAAGWRWQGTNGVWYSSVMSYTAAGNFPSNPVNSTRVGYFSNPSVSFMGAATGHATNGDNARAIRNTKHAIAAYRSTATINCIECPGYDLVISPGNSWATHSSSIAASGCKMYRVLVEKGRTYTFKTGCGNGATASFDTYLHVYDEDCSQVAFNDDGCEVSRSVVTWMATYTGYAYLKVRGWGGASGTYTVAYQRTDELTWQGDISTNWNTAGNWDGNVVPDATFDVIIPTGAVRQPSVSSAHAACKSLTLNSGATLTIGAYNLTVEYDADIYGTLTMNNTNSKLYVNDDIRWQSGSSASATGNATIYVYGDWDFMDGANVYLNAGYVDFQGTSLSYIRSKDSDSHFYHVRNNKSGTSLSLSANSTFPCRLTGNLYIYSGCSLSSPSSQSIIIGNYVNNMSGSIALSNGTFVFDGSSTSSSFVAGDYFNNVTISSTGTTTFNQDVEIRGNLLIESGALSLGSTTLTIKGNWQNNVGTAAFAEGTSRVIFAGASHQYVYSSETFNILEAAMGAALRINNAAYTVTCNQYDWTSGGIDVVAGTFTALDLADNGLYGGFWVNPGGTINLTNSGTGTYVDLVGQIYNYGGTMNISGSTAYWPYSNSAKLTMSGGIIDIKTCRIYMPSTFNFETINITGGTIRTPYGFEGDNANFKPAAGTLELYGSGNYSISQSNGSTIHHVNINKSAKEGGEQRNSGPVYDERSGELISDGGKANTITLSSNFEITGNLTINAGTFNANDKIISIGGNWINNIGPSAFNEGTSRVIFNGSAAQFCSTENFNILEVNKPAQLLYNVSVNDISCQIYDWTSGGIWISNGNFTAYDLADNGLRGTFAIFTGVMNLHQDNGQFIDFGGNISIGNGGVLNIHGGNSRSYWPYYSNASLTMSGNAVLDIKNWGIYVYDHATYTFTTNITGGTIKTSGGFESNRSDFTPTAGLFEFYGADNATISQLNGSTLYDVLINKSAKENNEGSSVKPQYDQRSGALLSDGGKANTISLSTNFTITHNLTVANGSLKLNAKTLNVNRDCIIQGTLNMTNAADVLNAGTYYFDWLDFKPGSTAYVTHGTINCYGWIIPRAGSNFNLGIDNTVYIKGESGGGLSNLEPSATYGNVFIDKNTGNYAVIDGLATEPVVVNGNFTMSASNTFRTQYNRMTVHGLFTDVASSSIYVLDWTKKEGLMTSSSKEPVNIEPPKLDYYLEIDTDFTLHGALTINHNGKVSVHGEFSSVAGSSITINDGSFIADSPNHPDKGWEYLGGNLAMTAGLFEITNNSIRFDSPATTNISGGILRTGGAFHATDPGVFQPTGGVVEIIGSDVDVNIFCYNGNYFHNLLVNRDAGYSAFNYGEPAIINNNLTIQHGELRTGNSQVSILGNAEVNDGGSLYVSGTGSILMGASRNITINNGGSLEFYGTLAYQPKISRISTGNYALNIESGGTIAAQRTIFEYMNTYGVNVKAGAIVDPAKAFAGCTFRLGQSGGRLLTLNNSQSLAIQGAIFPGSPSNYNVSKNVNSGVVTFTDYSGAFSGPAREQDPNSRIHWTGAMSPTVNLEGVNIASGQEICFEALQTITTGGAAPFIVENGGTAHVVAGQNILMLPGTHAKEGSYFHAWISSVGYCNGVTEPMVASKSEELQQPAVIYEFLGSESFFKVYPNPTHGSFTLELTQTEGIAEITVEIYTMRGERLVNEALPYSSHYRFDLSGQQAGMYLIRVTMDQEVGLEKMIKY